MRLFACGRFVSMLIAALGACAPAFAFDLQAHRGGRGLRPENTLAAFENAIRMGVTTLEMDVAITADGMAVISHDAAFNPGITRDASGQWLKAAGPLIKSLSLAEVRTFDVGRLNPDQAYGKPFAATQQARDGQHPPTLAEVFELAREIGSGVHFDIETKVDPRKPNDTVAPEEMVRIMLATIREAGVADRVMIQSFDWRTLQLVQRLEPRIRTTYLTVQTRTTNNVTDPAWTAGMKHRDHPSVPHMVKAAGGSIWAPNHASLDEPSVRTAQGLGLQVIPWTVNDPADMQRLLDWKVDGIITDYPDRLREVMRERGMPLPAGAGS